MDCHLNCHGELNLALMGLPLLLGFGRQAYRRAVAWVRSRAW